MGLSQPGPANAAPDSLPDHQERAGPAGLLGQRSDHPAFRRNARYARARGYRWIDCSLTSEDNPRTPALAEWFGAKLYKRLRVYRKKIT